MSNSVNPEQVASSEYITKGNNSDMEIFLPPFSVVCGWEGVVGGMGKECWGQILG